jgi:hypothetical protein
MLLTYVWAFLSMMVGQLVVAAPAPDVLLVAIDPDRAHLEKLRASVRAMYGKAERPVSQDLFRWTAGRWVVVP